MDGALARAARHLCKVSARTVARRAGVEPKQLRRYEKGAAALSTEQIQRVSDALSYYGAMFVAEDAIGGVGVRRRFTRTNVRMIETWEGEGGPVGSDDV
ncbi:hypothetical protein SCNU_13979 [Gordonia neofelifaecis NRRL B-59395]|uniref:HTH cro/C1-type domain-containing protein n=2 Tax=Gordonia TaxID=2053 RepID=F1YLK4_9ACTN|nr:hypothetical protein SCNU_13979 [Gordonia neofelifaecis NRRL B-59395]